MFRAILVCLILSTVFLSSCDYVPMKKKLRFYTEITATNDSINRMTGEWYGLLKMSVRDSNFSRLRPYRLKMGTFLSSNRSSIANLQAGATGQNIIDSEEVFLSNQATVINDVYSTFEAYNEMTPAETINAQMKLLANDQNNELAWTTAIKGSLEVYARKNKLKISK